MNENNLISNAILNGRGIYEDEYSTECNKTKRFQCWMHRSKINCYHFFTLSLRLRKRIRSSIFCCHFFATAFLILNMFLLVCAGIIRIRESPLFTTLVFKFHSFVHDVAFYFDSSSFRAFFVCSREPGHEFVLNWKVVVYMPWSDLIISLINKLCSTGYLQCDIATVIRKASFWHRTFWHRRRIRTIARVSIISSLWSDIWQSANNERRLWAVCCEYRLWPNKQFDRSEMS